MKNSLFPLLLLILFCFSRCQPDTRSREVLLSAENIESQSFTIITGRDTILTTKGGSILKIAANTFPKGKTIQLAIREVLTKADIIKSGLSTIDSEGRILESGGMIYVQAVPQLDVNPRYPIEIQLPSQDVKTKMQLFTLSEATDAGWILQGDLTNKDALGSIENGKTLYEKQCATCHSKNLREVLTGPALGNVTQFRDLNWLIAFTQNSQWMMSKGDLLANCLWSEWKPTVMPGFKYLLTPEQIEDIYTFIANESQLQHLEPDEISYTSNCNIATPQTQLLQGDYQDSSSFSIGDPADTSILYNYYVDPTIATFQRYQFNISKFGWYNVDYFLSEAIETQLVDPVEIKVQNEQLKYSTVVVLVFKNRNAIIQTQPEGEVYKLLNSFSKDKTQMPIGEAAWLIAIDGFDKDESFFAKKSITIGSTNHFEVKMQKTPRAEIEKFLKTL